MNSSSSVELVDEDFVFYVLQQTVVTMVTIARQLLPGKVSRFLKSKVVKEE